MAKSKIQYDDRTDLEKLQSQWNKIGGIFDRGQEWSAAIVRAATSAEIAANVAIRKRFEAESQFSEEFVDSLLVWANGLEGKFRRLIIPAEQDAARKADLSGLKKKAEKLSGKRNAIVHRGAFADRREAKAFVKTAREIVMALVIPWEPTFLLDDEKEPKKLKRQPQ